MGKLIYIVEIDQSSWGWWRVRSWAWCWSSTMGSGEKNPEWWATQKESGWVTGMFQFKRSSSLGRAVGTQIILCTPWSCGKETKQLLLRKGWWESRRKIRWEQSRVRVNEKTAQDFSFEVKNGKDEKRGRIRLSQTSVLTQAAKSWRWAAARGLIDHVFISMALLCSFYNFCIQHVDYLTMY